MFQTLGLFSEFERSIIRNRVEAGLARRRGCAAPASRIKAMMKRTHDAGLARIPLLVADPRLPTPRVSMVIPASAPGRPRDPRDGAEYFLIASRV
jgi:hypothetical protein